MQSNHSQSTLESLHIKLDKLLVEFAELKAIVTKKANKAQAKPKALPLTEDEIANHKQAFLELFELWRGGKEIEVQDKLDKYDLDRLRRFADANNLNVTSRMPKQRILTLISARFREKRLLLR